MKCLLPYVALAAGLMTFAASRGFAGAPPSSTTMVWDDATKTLTVTDSTASGDYYLERDLWVPEGDKSPAGKIVDTQGNALSADERSALKIEKYVINAPKASVRLYGQYDRTASERWPYIAPNATIEVNAASLIPGDKIGSFKDAYYITGYTGRLDVTLVLKGSTKFDTKTVGECYTGNKFVLEDQAWVWINGVTLNPTNYPAITADQVSSAYAYGGMITVRSGSTAVLKGGTLRVGNDFDTHAVFNVEENAEMRIETPLVDKGIRQSSLVKRGLGKLIIAAESQISGVVRVEAGTLEIAKGGSLAGVSTIYASDAATVSFAPGVMGNLPKVVVVPAAVFKATTHLDSAVYGSVWGNFQYVRGLGAYEATTYGADATADNRPIFSNGKPYSINDIPAFYFKNSNDTYFRLKGFKNETKAMRVFAVIRDCSTRKAWQGYFGVKKDGDNSSIVEAQVGNTGKNDIRYKYHGNDASGAAYGSWTVYPYGDTTKNLFDYTKPFILQLGLTNAVKDTNYSYLYGGVHQANTSYAEASQMKLYMPNALNHDTLELGLRGDGNGSTEFVLGEFMLFCGDTMTAEDEKKIVAYLRKKWFGTEIARDPAVAAEKRTVATDAQSVVGDNANVAKDGAGTLFVDGAAKAVAVNEGALAFTGPDATKAAVWFDFDDASTLTMVGTGLDAVKNKGSLGGSATTQTSVRSPISAAATGSARKMLGTGTTRYDFTDARLAPAAGEAMTVACAFSIDSWTTWRGIFGLADATVMAQSDDVTEAAAEAFSLQTGNNAVTQMLHFPWKNGSTYAAYTLTYSAVKEQADIVGHRFIAIIELNADGKTMGFHLRRDGDGLSFESAGTKWVSSGANTRAFSTLRMGSRINNGAKCTPTDSSWMPGKIGEMIVFNRTLDVSEKKELADYLDRKWLKLEETVSVPDCLQPAQKPGSAQTLAFADGTTYLYRNAPVAVTSLTVPANATVTVGIPEDFNKKVDHDLFTYTDASLLGTFAIPGLPSSWRINIADGKVSLVKDRGMAIIFR